MSGDVRPAMVDLLVVELPKMAAESIYDLPTYAALYRMAATHQHAAEVDEAMRQLNAAPWLPAGEVSRG